MVNGEQLENVADFVYQGAYVDKEGGGSADIGNRLQRAQSAFQRLKSVVS